MTHTTDALIRLESSGLIRVGQLEPEIEYLFRHALVQEAAYESLLKQDRRTLHLAVGEAMEKLYADRLNEIAPLLSHHFDLAEDTDRALKYLTMAGDVELTRFATAEAIMHFSRALEIAASADRREALPHLYTQRGHAYEHNGQYDDALANNEEMLKVARQRGDRPMELAALMALATLRATTTPLHNAEEGHRLCDESLALARALGNREAEATILWNLMLLHGITGQTEDAVKYGEESLGIARDLKLREQLAYTLNDLASHAYIDLGMYDRALEALAESRAIWRDLDIQPMLADNFSTTAMFHYLRGEYDQVLTNGAQARQISQAIDNLWGQSYSMLFEGQVYRDRGEPERGLEVMETCVSLGEQAGFIGAVVGIGADAALLRGTLGQIKPALERARRAVQIAAESLPTWWGWPASALIRLLVMGGDLDGAEAVIRDHLDRPARSFFTSVIGMMLAEFELRLAQGDLDRARAAADRLLDNLKRANSRPFVAEAQTSLTRVLLAQGDRAGARAAAASARSTASEIGSRWMLWQILALEADIEAGDGKKAEAAALRAKAAEVVKGIAKTIKSAELRESFLKTPPVRAVLGAPARPTVRK